MILRYTAILLAILCTLPFEPYAQVDLNKGLVAYYPFNGNANDASGNGNNPVFNNATLTTDYYGNAKSAYQFNGIDNYMRIPNKPSLNPSNTISICVWVKPTGFYKGTCHGNSVLMKGDDDFLPGNYFLRFDDGFSSGGTNCSSPVDSLRQTYYSGNVNYNKGDTPYVQKNIWRSVVYTNDGSYARLYIDCNLISEVSASGLTFSNAYDLMLGKLNNPLYPYWFNGVLDEVRIYNRAINADEVKAYSFGCKGVQTCDNWLKVNQEISGVQIGDLDISGTQLTVEALINRTTTYDPLFNGGDVVSKHDQPSDDNYLLRPTSASLHTNNGFYQVGSSCEIELNKTYHIAMVYDGSTLKFYRNGFVMGSIPASGSLTLNNWLAKIGTTANVASPYPADFIGYIDEVRIWNVARTQSQIKQYMNASLPNPATQTGLKAYYTFEDLKNKQGNSAWDGSILGDAAINKSNPTCSSFTVDSCGKAAFIIPSFTAPDTVCINTPVTITNTTVGATNYYWSFCGADFNTTPVGQNLGNPGTLLNAPVFMDYALNDDGNYYGFVVNYNTSHLIRLAYGTSLLNTPVALDLGNFSGALKPNSEGLQIKKVNGRWIIVIVSGGNTTGTASTIMKLDFGASLANTPTATNWGNIGGLNFPHDLFISQEGTNFYGYTTNINDNTLTRFNFGTDFSATPTGTNLGNFGSMNYPCGFSFVNTAGNWFAFITNRNSNTITRLSFGASLLNTPTGTNIGNPGGFLQRPRDISILESCNGITGLVVNEQTSFITRLDFGTDLTATPAATNLGNIGTLSFPHSIAKFFIEGNDIYSFVTNVTTNSITRIRYQGCTSTTPPSSTLRNPSPVTYTVPGTYNINLLVDIGLPTQASVCKQIVVEACSCDLNPDFTYSQDPCNPKKISFKNETANSKSVSWSFGNGDTSTANKPVITYKDFGTYTVRMIVTDATGCKDTATKNIAVAIVKDSVIITKDTTVCRSTAVQLNTLPALSYCWSPGNTLSDSTIANPKATPLVTTTYTVTAKTAGVNLVANGNFSAGNTGFSSEYNYTTTNTIEGQYFVGPNPQAWNGQMQPCVDHTNGTGNMLLVNGSPALNKKIWCETINGLKPNTNYSFAAWVQSLSLENFAQLQFYINGNIIGTTFTASSTACLWKQFFAEWNSGTNTTANICIVNKNTLTAGNDFGLDDISFTEQLIKQDTVKITISTATVNAGKDSAICPGASVQLNASGATKYKWNKSPYLSDTTIANPIANPPVTTKFIVHGYNALGCEAVDTVLVTVRPKPPVTVTNDTAVCIGSSIRLSATGGTLVAWAWAPGTTLSSTTVSNPLATPKDTTEYFITVTDNNGCKNTDSVTVNTLPLPVVATIADSTICKGATITLATTGNAAIYAWSPATGLSSSTVKSPQASPKITTEYFVTATSADGCAAVDSVTLSIKPLPAVTSTEDTVICGTGEAQLMADAPGALSYQWSPVTGLSNATIYNPVASPKTTTRYTVTVLGPNGCYNSDSTLVSIFPKPAFGLKPKEATVCEGKSVTLTASGGDQYTWLPDATLSTTSGPVTIATPVENTVYTVNITENNCKESAMLSTTVTVLDGVNVKAQKLNDIDCFSNTANLLATGAETYSWSPATGLDNPNIANPVANPSVTTTYTVTGSNSKGCTGTDTVTVKVSGEAKSGYYMPDAFTPNGDGLNDCIGLKYWGNILSVEYKIYNRWGNLVFSAANGSSCWDGTYSGKAQPSGTYVYYIRANTSCGYAYKQGTIVLIR